MLFASISFVVGVVLAVAVLRVSPSLANRLGVNLAAVPPVPPKAA